MSETITIPRPADMHFHGRQGERLRLILPYHSRDFGVTVFEPNLRPDPDDKDFEAQVGRILTGHDVDRYHGEVVGACPIEHRQTFKPMFLFQVTDQTTADQVRGCRSAGAVGGKVYMDGVTTNSENGVTVNGFKELLPIWKEMAGLNMVVQIHGEHPAKDAFCMRRENLFHNLFAWLAQEVDDLRIVYEHVTCAPTIRLIEELGDNVAGSITLHHLMLTLDNVVGGNLEPHHFCKPIAKAPEDRAELQRAVLSGNPKFFFGSDSAPHRRGKKESAQGCAGVWTSPVAIPGIAKFFDDHGKLDSLSGFFSEFGPKFYRITPSKDRITILREPFTVPESHGEFRSFLAGEELPLRVVTK
jgi:dihydroorotase